MNLETQDNATEIAVIGLGGRFPGAHDPGQFRENLRRGFEAIRFLSDDELLQRGVDPEVIHAPRFVKAAADVPGIENFDHAFFGFTPRDAEMMDPQLRLLLECAWSTLEHAGCNPENVAGAIGVFAGAAPNTYFQENLLPDRELMRRMNAPLAPLAIYTASDALSTMVSFKLNLRGPSITVQTACSTSLVAVHLAVQSLLSGECDMALAGGVNLTVPQAQGYSYQEGMILSPDGHCRPFEARAAGTIFGDGLGLVLLKRLEDALNDGDHIHAVIKGSAVNNDGSQKAGFTAPSVAGQAAAMAEAISVAGVSADTIGYVEAHGTGTALGDPIEIEALTRAFRRSSTRKGYCGIGSVKSNIGHLDRAAGVASLIKTIGALEDRQIPPTLHFSRPNPKIDFDRSPFRVVDRLTPWAKGATPRRAAVNSVGFGGTNACVVLEEAPAREPSSPSRPCQLLLLSARSEDALATATQNLADHLAQHPETNLADTAFTLQVGRSDFDFRRVLTARDATDVALALKNPASRRVTTGIRPTVKPSIVFMFPGQGSQRVGMGQGLYQHEIVFRTTVDECAELLRPELDLDVRDILYPAADRGSRAEARLEEVRFAQPALFVVEYALAKLWMSWGLQPAAMIGHSVGEYVAACLSGVFSVRDALHLVAVRARLVQEQPAGAMLAVRVSEDDVVPMLEGRLSIAAVNSPSLTVVSGPASDVSVLEEKLATQRVASRRVQASHAFHSSMMDPVVAPFVARLRSITLGTPEIPFISNVTGTWATPEETRRPEYWASHLRGAVRFRDGVAAAVGDQARIFLEVGPGMTLGQMVRQNLAKRPDTIVVASLGTTSRGEDEVQAMLEGLSRLWIAGVPIDWRGFYANERRYRVPLPTYPFEKKRFWIEPIRAHASSAAIAAAPDAPDDGDEGKVGRHSSRFSVTGGSEVQHDTVDAPGRDIMGRLRTILQELSGMPATDLQDSATFLEMGLDSLFLAQFSRGLESEFGIAITFGQLVDEIPTLLDLARHLESETLPVERGRPARQQPTVSKSGGGGDGDAETIDLAASLRTILRQLSGLTESDLSETVTFLEMGLDSLFLAQFSAAIEREFDVTVGFGQLADEFPTLRDLARHLQSKRASPVTSGAVSGAEVEQMRALIQTLTLEIERLKQREPVWSEDAASPAQPDARSARTEGVATRVPTAGQREIWLASQLGENATRAYNELVLLRLDGDLQLSALEASLQEVVDRHDSLRATFSADGAHQYIHATREQDLTVIDLSGIAEGDRDDRAQEVVDQLGRTVFNLVDGPLMKAHLIRREERSHLLHLAFHHVVVDGWSTHIIASELGRIYSNRTGAQLRTPPSAMPYRDYVDWYHRADTVLRRAEDERFWVEAFADRPTAVELPACGARPRTRSHRAGHVSAFVDRESYQRFKNVSAKCNATLFHFLLTTFHAWLHRVTGQSDIVVGVPVAGQLALSPKEFPDSHCLVGHCANLLPVRSRMAGDVPFRESVGTLKQQMMVARKHELFTYGELVGKLNLPRETSRVPLVSVTFNLSDDPPLQWHGLDVDAKVPPLAGLFFDLEVNVWETSGGLRVSWYYASDLVDVATVERWLRQWQTLMNSAAEAPDLSLGELSILDPVERGRVLDDGNRTVAAYPRERCIHQLFAAQSEQTPKSPAVEFGNETLTYDELSARTNQLAWHLKAQGIGPGKLVGLCLDRSARMVVGVLAILKAGGAYVPLDPAHPRDRIAYIMADAGIVALVTETSTLATLGAVSVPIVCLDRDRTSIQARSVESCDGDAGPSDLAYVIYTSGSTGRPKGVQIEHRAAVNLLSSMHSRPGIDARDGLLAVTTLSFDIAGLEIFLPLISGARVIVAAQESVVDGAELIRIMRDRNVTVMQATPATWRLLLEAGWTGQSDLKILCGGEPLPKELSGQLLPRCRELWNVYGPTETTIWSTCCRVTDPEDIHIGRPINNTEAYVVDARLQPVPVGVVGELLIGGDGLARGYLHRPDLTAEKFIAHPFSDRPGARIYRTGDLARWRADGNLDCLGRMDFQVKIRGYRVELGEIETELGRQPGVRNAVADVCPDQSGELQLVAYVVPENGSMLDWKLLRQGMRVTLPEYMIPSKIVHLPEIPLTPNGKIDRKALRTTEPTVSAEVGRTEPRNAVETKLAAMFAEVLGIEAVGIDENFFDLGGHSLLAVKLMAEIESMWGVRLPLALLFTATTVEGLARHVKSSGGKTDAWRSLVPIVLREGQPNFFLVHGAGGNVLLYRDLAQLLAPEFSVYGFQSIGLDRKQSPLKTIEEMALHYVDELRSFQPSGPYHLGGYCMGGVVAFEMARILREAGLEVLPVVMLDSYNLSSLPTRGGRRFSTLRQKLGFHINNLRRLRPIERRAYFLEKLRMAREAGRGYLRAGMSRVRNSLYRENEVADGLTEYIQSVNDEAVWQFVPRFSTVSVTLFKPEKTYDFFSDPQQGWGAVVGGSIAVVELPVSPHGMLIDPFVRQLAQQIKIRVITSARSNVQTQPSQH